jgi:uncharacterized repeat protein (TIGR01451 family)
VAFGGHIYSTSLALDSSDRPHISFYDNDFEHSEQSYKYASYNGTAWQIQTIESDVGASAELVSSIAVDSSENPHVSFPYLQTTPTTMYFIRYASYNGTAWNTENVTDKWSGEPSLALDSNDFPHISYNIGSGSDHLGYATYNGTSWNTFDVDGNVHTGRYSSIAIDRNDYPHISHHYEFSNTSSLKYAYKDALGWHNQTVDSSVTDTDDVGLYTSLAVDNVTGYPRISYIYSINPSTYRLKYASYNGTAWNIETVDTQNVLSFTSLALDSCGYPHISYYHPIPGTSGNSGALKYARFIPAPGLAVSKGGSAVSKVGDNITYWVNISNTGDVPLQKVSVSDNRSGTVTDISGWFSDTLSVGASESRTYTYTVKAEDEPGPIVNNVTAVYGDAYGGTCFSNLSVSDNHSVALVHPSIEVTKTPVNPISKVGDNVTFTITINNTGDCPLIRDSVSDNLSVWPDPDTYGDFAYIPALSSISGNFTYTVQDTDPDPLGNMVIVHYHPEGLLNDITDNATCYVDLRHPDILVTKAVAAGTYRAGDTITYLLSINNTSTDITLVKDSIIDSLAGDITSLFSDNITAGGSESHIYTYTVKATDPDPLMNDVIAHYHPDGLTNDIFDGSYANVFLAPTITSVTPNQGAPGQTLDVTINGSQLNRVNAVDFGAGITINSVTAGPNQIIANINIDANAAPGPRDITVTNPVDSDTLLNGFTVQQSQASVATATGTGEQPPSPPALAPLPA